MENLTIVNMGSIFPHAPKGFFRKLEGRTACVRVARLGMASDNTWYMRVDQWDFYRRRLELAWSYYYRLDVDMFGFITAVKVGTPPLAMIERHWLDLPPAYFAFVQWHLNRFLPWLNAETRGYDRVLLKCPYFAPRGIDNPCDELEKANTYAQSGRARRDAAMSGIHKDIRAGRRPGRIVPLPPARKFPGIKPRFDKI